MVFKEINEKNLKNGKLISSENLEQKEYIQMYSLYRKLFTEYVIENLNLQEYDNKIKTSELNFHESSEKEMDVYQYFSSDVLKYLYIRNNIYIEKLKDKEKEFLAKKIKEKNFEYGSEEKKFIKNTFKHVICRQEKKDKPVMVFYGVPSRRFMAPNDSIIIGFRYNEFYNDGLNDNEWKELHQNQIQYAQNIVQEITENSKKSELNDVIFIKYDQFSTIPMI